MEKFKHYRLLFLAYEFSDFRDQLAGTNLPFFAATISCLQKNSLKVEVLLSVCFDSAA